jgi:hypothetical protein
MAIALSAVGAEFSHELHLKLVPTCVGCHSSAATSTQASDNLLPSDASCLKCHKEVSIKQPRQTVVAKFNHQLHARLGPTIAPMILQVLDKRRYLTAPAPDLRRHLNISTNKACTGCHRGMDEIKVVSAANHPHMADCLVCHNKIDPPESCATCHSPASMQFRPSNHTADILDRHTTKTSGLDKTTCAVCHGRTFTCLGCH